MGEAAPLMLLEDTEPSGKGEDKGKARRSCPRSQSGKNRRGMQPEGLPKRSAEREGQSVSHDEHLASGRAKVLVMTNARHQ